MLHKLYIKDSLDDSVEKFCRKLYTYFGIRVSSRKLSTYLAQELLHFRKACTIQLDITDDDFTLISVSRSTSDYLMEAAGVYSGCQPSEYLAKNQNKEGVTPNKISTLDILNIAKLKLKDMNTDHIDCAVSMIRGTMNSCGFKEDPNSENEVLSYLIEEP